MQRLTIVGAVLLLLAVVYIAISLIFLNRFLPGTVIDGISCGGRTVNSTAVLFEEKVQNYTLTITESGGATETISGTDIDLETDLGTSLEDALAAQNAFAWIAALVSSPEETTVEAIVNYDTTKLAEIVSAMSFMDESQMTESVDVSLSEYEEGTGYTLVSEVYGTVIDKGTLYQQLYLAITSLEEEINLRSAGCYEDPSVTSDSEEAAALLAEANALAGTTITYTFGDDTEVVDGSLISQWITIGEDFSITLDEELIADYVSELADTYDTKWKSRTLVSHSGETVTVPSGGNYGWRVNQDDTVAALIEYLENHEDYTGEVVYYQTAAQYGEQDYGDTYIEVSISEQHFWYYVDGVCVLESDLVSGDVSNGTETPTGCYVIAYKSRDQILTGEGYTTPVSYWIPFVDGVGFHDATWRDSFGGTIYLTDGSHGCLNLPYWAAKELYELVEAGTAVLVY